MNTDKPTLDQVITYLTHRLDGMTMPGAVRMTTAARDYLVELQAENEKLRAELEQKEKYYEQMVDALAATESADLAQMTACVYYKPGGLCRYGGDDPANVCVLGPCPHERTAEEVLADLVRVTAERDAAQALPCKVGDTVYQVDDIRVYALEVRNLIYDAGILAFDESTIGKTVFLTRAEAEAALRREQDGN